MNKIKKLHVRSGDTVVVISGDEKGKKGKVLKAMPERSSLKALRW